MPRTVTTLLVAMLVALPAMARGQSAKVEDIRQWLRTGDQIRIVDATGAVTHGRFESVSATSVDLRVRGKHLAIPTVDVRQVRVRRKEGDGVLVGMGLGAATGIVFTRMECGDDRECRSVAGEVGPARAHSERRSPRRSGDRDVLGSG